MFTRLLMGALRLRLLLLMLGIGFFSLELQPRAY
jgi:hypothetical protein